LNEKTSENKTQKDNVIEINPIWVVLVVAIVLLVVIGFYYYNFNSHILKSGNWWNVFYNLSQENGDWGTFGDYVGGLLNPVIAVGALYLIAQTYKLQKKELAKTTELLEISTQSQDKQIKLAALPALLHSNLTRINLLISEKVEISQKIHENTFSSASEVKDIIDAVEGSYEYGFLKEMYGGAFNIVRRLDIIEREVDKLRITNIDLERKINSFL
jgi:hypothetical protein